MPEKISKTKTRTPTHKPQIIAIIKNKNIDKTEPSALSGIADLNFLGALIIKYKLN